MSKKCDEWLNKKRNENTLTYEKIEWGNSEEWTLSGGNFKHKTNSFFLYVV